MTADKDGMLAERVRAEIRGRVFADRASRERCATDQSIYRIMPRVVAVPEDPEDVGRLVEIAVREGIPITARGGGSGTAGSALGSGIVVALQDAGGWSDIGDFDSDGNTARVRVGAGARHNRVQEYLRQRGYFLPADVSSAEVSCIGGNIATRASGPHALRYGSIDRFLEQVTFVTDRCERVDTADEKSIPTRILDGLAELGRRLRADPAATAVLHARSSLKTASGYNMAAFLRDLAPGELVTQLLAGSVGTLGLVTGAVLRSAPYREERAALLLHFEDLADAARAVSVLREHPAAAIELVSRETVKILREKGDLPDRMGGDAHLLLAEFTGPDAPQEAVRADEALLSGGVRLSGAPAVARDRGEIDRIWEVRKRILWLIREPVPGIRALSVVNDVGVPPDRLAPFIGEVETLFARHRLTTLIYGHAGNGNLHLRPLFDLSRPGLAERIRRLADEVYDLVLRHGGTITAEHGMGRLRAPYLEKEWGATLYGYMREVKTIFDPRDMFNPGVMFGSSPITDHLREELLQHEEARHE